MAESNWHQTEIRVRYKDTDRMGVVYYGNYLTYFEVGRTAYMRDLGFPYARLEAEGYHLSVTEVGAQYQGNVGYDALLTIRTAVSHMKKVRLRFDYEVLDQDGRLLVRGHTVHACVDADHRPVRIPQELRQRVEEDTS